MRRGYRLALNFIAIALFVALSTSTATANRSLNVSGSGRTITLTSAALTLAGANGVNIICEVTLKGSLHAAIEKTRGALVGFLTEGRTANCRDSLGLRPAEARFLFGTAWHLTYESFTGTLPEIREALFIVNGYRFLFRLEVLECLYEGNVPTGSSGSNTATSYTATRLEPLRNSVGLISAINQEIFRRCPTSGEFMGSYTIGPEIGFTLT